MILYLYQEIGAFSYLWLMEHFPNLVVPHFHQVYLDLGKNNFPFFILLIIRLPSDCYLFTE